MGKNYEPNWESLKNYQVPSWFKDAKFGIFIHWGPFSVPAFGGSRENDVMGNGVWYQNAMYKEGSEIFEYHRNKYGNQKDFGFKDFIPMFKGENFNAKEWIDIIKKSGAKYFVPVADYHDGFPMFDCSYSGKWTAVHMGPKRDVVGELEIEARKAGLKFGASSHRVANWMFYAYKDEYDTVDPENVGLYGKVHAPEEEPDETFIQNWEARTRELVEKYDLDLIWFDFGWEWPSFDKARADFIAWYYNWAEKNGKEGVLQSKGEIPHNMMVFDVERGGLEEMHPYFWQVDTSVSKKSWCYDIEEELKTPKQIIDQLVDVVSKNGGMLLNVGPKADGTIPQEHIDILVEIGRWLDINGEAIFNTRPWWVHGEGDLKWNEKINEGVSFGAFSDADTPEMTSKYSRYTVNGDVLYCTIMGWPDSGKVSLRYLAEDSAYYPGSFKKITMLGNTQELKWVRDRKGLHVDFPEKKGLDYAYVLKIEKESL